MQNNGAALRLGERAFIVTGKHSGRASGALADVIAALTHQKIECSVFEGIGNNPDVEQCRAVGAQARAFHADFIIGIGGGKVIDAAKYCGFLRNLAFISIPTSASSDGFSSASASLLVEGHRKSVPARLAYGIVVDTKIIKSAPKKFLYSGIGDMVSKITALYDWIFEEQHGYGKVNDFAVMIAKKAVNSFVRTPFESIEEDLFLKELLDSLAMSGIANEIAGSSAPTSGSEHLISHALDKMLEQPQLHGIQVGVATYLMSVVQDHRYRRVDTIFTQTGFWDYVKTVGMKREDFIRAIEKAPAIKPFRYTYLHEEQYRKKAIEVLQSDTKLSEVLQA